MIRKHYFILALLLLPFFGKAQSTVFHFHKFEVAKTASNGTFQINNEAGNSLRSNLRYVGYAGGALQVLTSDNKMIYLNEKLEEITFPEVKVYGYCGTIVYFTTEISETKNAFVVKRTSDRSIYSEGMITEETVRVSKEVADDIYFLNRNKSISYDENFYYPETLIVLKDGREGIYTEKEILFFDNIITTNENAIKVKKNGLWGIHGLTPLKFNVIGPYKFNLAFAETKDGKKGYIDLEGTEYF